jgi:hypothetical protein
MPCRHTKLVYATGEIDVCENRFIVLFWWLVGAIGPEAGATRPGHAPSSPRAPTQTHPSPQASQPPPDPAPATNATRQCLPRTAMPPAPFPLHSQHAAAHPVRPPRSARRSANWVQASNMRCRENEPVSSHQTKCHRSQSVAKCHHQKRSHQNAEAVRLGAGHHSDHLPAKSSRTLFTPLPLCEQRCHTHFKNATASASSCDPARASTCGYMGGHHTVSGKTILVSLFPSSPPAGREVACSPQTAP